MSPCPSRIAWTTPILGAITTYLPSTKLHLTFYLFTRTGSITWHQAGRPSLIPTYTVTSTNSFVLMHRWRTGLSRREITKRSSVPHPPKVTKIIRKHQLLHGLTRKSHRYINLLSFPSERIQIRRGSRTRGKARLYNLIG